MDTDNFIVHLKNLKILSSKTQLENKINQLEKNNLNVDNLRSSRKSKRVYNKNKLILKSQQRFTSEKRNVFTEEVSKIALSANDDKRYNQSIQ